MVAFIITIASLSAVPWAWASYFVYERGHARVAERVTAGAVVIRLNSQPRFALPCRVARLLGLGRTEVLFGGLLPRMAYCAHDPINDRAALLELYAAGFCATRRATVSCAALTAVFIAGVCLLQSAAIAAMAGLAAGTLPAMLIDWLYNQHRKARRACRREKAVTRTSSAGFDSIPDTGREGLPQRRP